MAVIRWLRAWKFILAWFGLALIIFIAAGGWNLTIFTVGFGILAGGLAYVYRNHVRPVAQALKIDNYFGFLYLSLLITALEETFCYVTGNRISYPVLWIDLAMVSILWTVWFGTWYFYLSKKYAYDEKEALLLAATTGIFYEYVGTGAILSNPAGVLIMAPLAIVVYAAIFVWPMQLIEFTGKANDWTKYPVSVLLPFVLTIPAAILLYIVFSVLHVW